MNDSKNDIAWKRFFDKHNILQSVFQNNHVIINSNDINEFREARLMTKFDHKSQLPALFSDNNLSILPISRGAYIIGNFHTFHKLEESDGIPVSRISFPSFLESINYNDITSESTAINCAFVSDILLDFTGEEKLNPTVSGRMSSSIFNYHINTDKEPFKICVENSQIEIDGGYEGFNSLNIIEAKNYLSKDFLIRQLYYPFRLWAEKITKKNTANFSLI
jgi:hypothetical protein